MIEIKDNNVDELINLNECVLIDFSAEWCGPCKILAKTLGQIINDQIVIANCNIEENSELADRFKIKNIPTVLFFKKGILVNKIIGNTQKADLETAISNLILKDS